MSGTKQGGVKASQTNIKKYGKDFYSKMGKKGGLAYHGKPRGFAVMDKERHKAVSAIGGANGKRGKATHPNNPLAKKQIIAEKPLQLNQNASFKLFKMFIKKKGTK